ncbi:P-loop containing nucleoside triphosphate hydrolase protein, partial [Absidia repens]
NSLDLSIIPNPFHLYIFWNIYTFSQLDNHSNMEALLNVWDLVLTWLFKLTEESFWLELLGDRFLTLLRRWLDNDVFFYGMLFYITPIVTSPFNRLLTDVSLWFNSYWYCTIKVKQDEYEAYNALEWYVASQLGEKCFRHVEAKILYIPQHHDGDNSNARHRAPKLELFPTGKRQEFYYKSHKIWVNVQRERPNTVENMEEYGGQLSDVLNMVSQVNAMSITMKTRQTSLLQSYLEEWMELHHKVKYGKMTIYKSSLSRYSEGSWVQVGTKASRSFDSVILKSGQKELLLNDILLFRQREQWYAELGLPYRRGYLLRGPPGTGKTSSVVSIASQLNMNLAILSITAQMDDERIQYLLRTMPYNSILLIEDIDHCSGFKKSKTTPTDSDTTSSRYARPQLSMTGILNALDGVTAQEGSMIFMSCNNMDDIEPALLRPGRIDIKMDLGYSDRSQIKAMYHRFMNKTTCSWDDDLTKPLNPSDNDNTLLATRKSPLSSPSLGSTTSTTIDNLTIDETTTTITAADRFADAIPCDYVTPAELQNFFISHLDTIQANSSPIECILSLVPGFLDTVRADREQAASDQVDAAGLSTMENQQAADSQNDADDDTDSEDNGDD